MKLIYKIYLVILNVRKSISVDQYDKLHEKYKALKTFHYVCHIDPTEYELKKVELEKKLKAVSSKSRYLTAKINSISWKLF